MVAWILVFHLIGLVFWLGSLLVVTHVLAIHSEEPSTEARATLGRLEMKLLKGLAHPGAALMVITGIILIGEHPHYLREHWLHAKLLLVVLLFVLDLRVYFRTTASLAGRAELRRRECMALHGAISLVFFGILILVLLKPFGMSVRRASDPVRLRPRAALPAGLRPAPTRNGPSLASPEEKVKRIIVEQLGVDESEVTPTARFVQDLGADSLDTVELVMAFEGAFEVEIPDEDAGKILTVKDAVGYIQAHIRASKN